MTIPSYSWAYTKPFYSIFIGVTATISFFSNFLLIYIIFTTTSKHLGSYRFLLAFFALCDMSATIGHAIVQPYIHMTSVDLYFFTRHGSMDIFGVSIGSISCVLFIATYFQTFLVLAYHYIYRYKTVASALGTSRTDNWTKSRWVLIGSTINAIYFVIFVSCVGFGLRPSEARRKLVPAEILEIYGIDLSDRRTTLFMFSLRDSNPQTNVSRINTKATACLGVCVLLFSSTVVVIVVCIYKTTTAFKSVNLQMMPTTRRMQRQLFRALLIQTAVPCIFSYGPLIPLMLTGIVSGISIGAFGNVLFTITAIFPAIDAFFVLFFILQFRIAVIRLFHLPCKINTGTSVEPIGTH